MNASADGCHRDVAQEGMETHARPLRVKLRLVVLMMKFWCRESKLGELSGTSEYQRLRSTEIRRT